MPEEGVKIKTCKNLQYPLGWDAQLEYAVFKEISPEALLLQQPRGFLVIPDRQKPTIIEVPRVTRNNGRLVVHLGIRATHHLHDRTWRVTEPLEVTEIPVMRGRSIRGGPHGAIVMTAACCETAKRAGLDQCLYVRTDHHNGLMRLSDGHSPLVISLPDFTLLRALT